MGVVKVNEEDNVLYWNKVVDLLNSLTEENKELKAEIEQSDLISKDIVCADIQHQLLKVTDENKELKKENEQLKSYKLYEDNKRLQLIIADLKKENEKLKKQVEDCRDYNAVLYKNCVQKDRRWLKRIKRVEDELEESIKENERLKQQLLYDGDDVCGICKHEYLVPSGDYFIGKCKKEHKECSKEDIKYCEDFELIQADLEDLIKRMDKELIVND